MQRIFTVHKSHQPTVRFSPNLLDSNVTRQTVQKTQSWALRLAEFNFTIEHIARDSNTWADMLTRWDTDEHEK